MKCRNLETLPLVVGMPFWLMRTALTTSTAAAYSMPPLGSSTYLHSLEHSFHIPHQPETISNNINDEIPDEEYYGLTNPMANTWAGSKHETHGGYLHRLGGPTPVGGATPPKECRPMASWKGYHNRPYGGYLDSLQQQQQQQQPHEPHAPDDDGSSH